MEKKSFFKRSLESFGRFSKTTEAKSFFLVLACLLTVAILILSVCMTGHKEKMDDTVPLEVPLSEFFDDVSSVCPKDRYSADEYWSALDSEKTADMFLPLPGTIDDAPETDDRIRIVRESPSGSTDFVSVATDTIIIVVLVFGGVSLFLLVLALVACLIGLLVKAVSWLACRVKGAFSDNPKKNAGISAGTDGETLEFLEFDLAERMRYVGIPGCVSLPPFRNESLPWNESVIPAFALPEWKDRYRIRFVFDEDGADEDLVPTLVMSSDIPVDKEFVAALSCLLSGRISREAFLEETGLSEDCRWYCDDFGNVNLVWPGRGTLWVLSIFGEFSREYEYLYGERICGITESVIRILNGEKEKGTVKVPESDEPASLDYTEADFGLQESAGDTDVDDQLVDFSDKNYDFIV